MPQRPLSPDSIAAHLRRVLKDGVRLRTPGAYSGSSRRKSSPADGIPPNCASWPWLSADDASDRGPGFLVQVSDQLFRGRVLEEKVFAVFLLEKLVDQLGTRSSACLNRGCLASAVGPITMRWCTT